jgi:hypothetical protein
VAGLHHTHRLKGEDVNRHMRSAGSPSQRTGAPSGLRAAIFVVLALVLLAFAGSASADSRIGSTEDSISKAAAVGGISEPLGVAVSKREAGDIYLLDGASNQRVDQFEPDGTWVRAFGWGVVPGAASGSGDLTSGSSLVTNVDTTSGRFVRAQLVSGPGIPPDTHIEIITPNELELSNPAETTSTGVALSVAAAPGNLPTDERQQLTVRATGGEFQLTFSSPIPGSTTATTANIPAASAAAGVQSALEALPNIGAGSVSVGGGPGDAAGTSPYIITFRGRLADVNVRQLVPSDVGLTGGSPSSDANISTPTQGAGVLETCATACIGESIEEGAESGRGSQPGQLRSSDEIAIDNDLASASYGDVYVVDQRNFRVQKYSPAGQFLLMFGGEVDKTTGADVCTAEDVEVKHDICGDGVPGTGPSHFYEENPPTGGGGSFAAKTWFERGSNSIAVGPDGTVYVGDYGRIQEFESSGAFAGEFTLPVGAGEEPQFVSSLAVDSAGDIYERSETNHRDGSPTTQVPGVREFSPAHALLRTFDAGPGEVGSDPAHIALDEDGDLFTTEPFTFRAFKPTGALYAEFTSDQVERPPSGIAIGAAAGKLYAPQSFERYIAVIPLPTPGAPTITEEQVTDIQPKTATLHGVVNPNTFNTEYRFQYITDKQFNEDGEAFGTGTESTPSPPAHVGPVAHNDPVQSAISGLTTATLYHYRIVAESHCNEAIPDEACLIFGSDQTFETLPAVSIRDFTTQTVGPELVQLKVELNPNGSASHYTIRYGGAAESYSDGSSEGNLAVGNTFVPKSVTFTGLAPNTPYHYQLLASNENGEVHTVDATFTTEASTAEERAAESCPNATLREENNSLALPDCRAYEQTTPPNKEGGEAFPTTSLAPSGERLVFLSEGVFAGALSNELTIPYLAQRLPSGWVTQHVVGRPGPPGTEPVMSPSEMTFSPELDRWVFGEVPALNFSEAFFAKKTIYLSMGFADGSYLLHASPTLNVLEGFARQSFFTLPSDPYYNSEDLSRLFIVNNTRLLASDPRPDGFASGSPSENSDRIYELSGVGGPTPALTLVAELPPGLATTDGHGGGTGCGINAHENRAVQNGAARWVSGSGSTMVYSAPIENVAGARCGPGTPNPVALFVHQEAESSSAQLNAVPTAQCHSPSPCASAAPATPAFDGLSLDGSRAWFTTTQPLVDSDKDKTGDLYLAKLDHGKVEELVQVTTGQAGPAHPLPGQGAGVLGVQRVSPDGSHVSFVATGVLTEDPNSVGDSAVSGADNLYVYDAGSGETKFVARLCSGLLQSGSTEDAGCPESSQSREAIEQWELTHDNVPPAQFTPDGNYLLFRSFGRLTPDDTDNAPDIYRYDFQTGQLIRISFGRDGNDADGNDDAYPVSPFNAGKGEIGHVNEPAEDSSRSISSDGSVVIFETAAPLVSRDTNGQHIATGARLPNGEPCTTQEGCLLGNDIYEWEEAGHGTCRQTGGCISLVSDGLDANGALFGVIGSSGRDITFSTQRGEVPGDTDGVGDIYDARVDGGFPRPQSVPVCLSGEGCRGPLAPPPAPPKITSEGETGGNGAQQLQCAKGKVKVKKHGQIRCVAKKHHKKVSHRKNKHHKRTGHNKRASHNKGGGK